MAKMFSLYAVVGVHLDASAAAEGGFGEALDALGAHAAHPDESAGGDFHSVLQYHFMVLEVYDFAVQEYVDSHVAEEVFRCLAGLFGEAREEAPGGLDEVDVQLGAVDVGVVCGEDVALHLGEHAGNLHARCTAADNHDVQEFPTLLLRGAGRTAFEVSEQGVP